MLRFLLDVETRDGHLSVTGVDGRGPGERDLQFDQQPIEVASIADACARAYDLTGDAILARPRGDRLGVVRGRQRLAACPCSIRHRCRVRRTHSSGGRNENRGAESTLAALSTYQQARRSGVLDRVSL